MSLTLGVNIDHVATLREARYKGSAHGEPCPVSAALQCEAAGAHGITAHLREDRRHIQDRDIARLRESIATRLNLEMADTPEMLGIALRTKPFAVCLVPEKRQEITTEGGLDVVAGFKSIRETCFKLQGAGIHVSLFIAPDPAQVEASARCGAHYIELHTGRYAEVFSDAVARQAELARLVAAAVQAHGSGVRVNAGHGLNTDNVRSLFVVPHMEELNIGHSIVSRAVSVGMTQAVKEMLRSMEGYPGERTAWD